MIKTLALLITFFSLPSYAESWHFDVYLDKSKIGSHTFDLNNGQLVSKAKFNVKILFINAYSYDHQATEQWSSNCLTNLKANTNDNGDLIKVNGTLKNQQLIVTANGAAQTLPACSMTFAYWNPAILKQKQLLNPQNAEYLDTNIQLINKETIQVKSKPLLADHYRIKAKLKGENKLNIDVWYDQKSQWVALQSTTQEGNKLVYKLR